MAAMNCAEEGGARGIGSDYCQQPVASAQLKRRHRVLLLSQAGTVPAALTLSFVKMSAGLSDVICRREQQKSGRVRKRGARRRGVRRIRLSVTKMPTAGVAEEMRRAWSKLATDSFGLDPLLKSANCRGGGVIREQGVRERRTDTAGNPCHTDACTQQQAHSPQRSHPSGEGRRTKPCPAWVSSKARRTSAARRPTCGATVTGEEEANASYVSPPLWRRPVLT